MFILGLTGTYIFRSIVNASIVRRLASSISQVENEIARKFYLSQIMTVITLLTTLVMLLVVIYIFPMFFSRKIVVGSIYTIYASIVLSAFIYFLFKVIPKILILIFKYKFNVKDFIYQSIYEKVYEESSSRIMNLSFFAGVMNSFFGKNSSEIAASITDDIFPTAIKLLLLSLIKVAIAIAAYIAIFVWLVQPVLLDENCGSDWYELFLCPFIQSVDFIMEIAL